MFHFKNQLDQNLYQAVMGNDINAMERALEAGGDVDAIDMEYGWQMLFILLSNSIKLGSIFLIEHGANINVINPNSNATPLHYACNTVLVDVVKLLLEKDINKETINAKDVGSSTPLHWVFHTNNIPDSIRLKITKLLVNHGADIKVKEEYKGSTALHLAAEKGAIQTAAFLIKKGVDINVSDNLQKKPIDYAYDGRKTEMIVFLLSKKAALPAYRRTIARSIPFVIQSIITHQNLLINKYRMSPFVSIARQLNDPTINAITQEEREKQQIKIGLLSKPRSKSKTESKTELNEKEIHISEIPVDIQKNIFNKAGLTGRRSRSNS